MIHLDLSRYAGWAAYLSAAATILGLTTLLVFFAVGEPFGTWNDILSIVIALSMIVILFELDRLHRPVAPAVRRISSSNVPPMFKNKKHPFRVFLESWNSNI